jgi:hypothetical protein
MPRTVVRRKHKAVPIGDLLRWLSQQQPIAGCRAGQLATNDPDYLLVPRAANRLVDQITATVRRAQRRAGELSGVDLPDGVRAILAKREPSAANCLSLGSRPDRVRIDASAVRHFVRQCRPRGLIVDGVTEESFSKVLRSAAKVPTMVALPPVFFEAEIPSLQKLLECCKRARATVEVNSWGGWKLARDAGVRMEGGPGLPVLNSLAARKLAELGLRSVTLSIEADRRKLQSVTASCPVPCSLVVFGRPPLLTSRVELGEEDFCDKLLVDRRQTRVKGRRERGLWVFRPVEPFDLRDLTNDRIRVAHIVVDLTGSEDPVADFQSPAEPRGAAFRFNYDRTLA